MANTDSRGRHGTGLRTSYHASHEQSTKHISLTKRPRCYAKSPTAQDVFQPIPGLISCAGVTVRWGLPYHAQNGGWPYSCVPTHMQKLQTLNFQEMQRQNWDKDREFIFHVEKAGKKQNKKKKKENGNLELPCLAFNSIALLHAHGTRKICCITYMYYTKIYNRY